MENIETKKLYQLIKSGNFNAANNGKKIQEGLNLLVKVAEKSSEADFVAFMQNGIVPAIKLTPQEMELVKGGWWAAVGRLVNAIGIVDFFRDIGKAAWDGGSGNPSGTN